MNICFDQNWNKKTVKNIVLNNCYLEFGKHDDLRAICINEEDKKSDTRDWIELTFIVPTKWLDEFCKKNFHIHNLNYFLQEEYTTKESEIIFEAALNERQVIMIDF